MHSGWDGRLNAIGGGKLGERGVDRTVEAALIEAPLDLEATFKGRRLEATVRPDGTVIFAGKLYTSLSVAADVARDAVTGPPSGGRHPAEPL